MEKGLAIGGDDAHRVGGTVAAKRKSLVRNLVSNFPNRNGPTSTTKIVQLPQLEWSNFRNRVIYRLMFRRFAGGTYGSGELGDSTWRVPSSSG